MIILFPLWAAPRLPDLCSLDLSHPIPPISPIPPTNSATSTTPSTTSTGSLHFSYSRGYMGGNLPHRGIDISVPVGSEIRAIRSGVIETLKWDRNIEGIREDGGVGFGYYIILRYDDGHTGYYAHLTPESDTHALGERVEAGEVIALSGNSGKSTGPHLHYGERDREGKWIDPAPLIVEAHLRDHPSIRMGRYFPPQLLRAHRLEKRKHRNCQPEKGEKDIISSVKKNQSLEERRSQKKVFEPFKNSSKPWKPEE